MKIELFMHLVGEELPPRYRRVLVAGGLAYWEGKQWRNSLGDQLTFQPSWWALIPTGNDPRKELSPEQICPETVLKSNT